MGFLDRLFGRKDNGAAATKENAVDEAIAKVECPHGTMAPRWERPEDFGKHDGSRPTSAMSAGSRSAVTRASA